MLILIAMKVFIMVILMCITSKVFSKEICQKNKSVLGKLEYFAWDFLHSIAFKEFVCDKAIDKKHYKQPCHIGTKVCNENNKSKLEILPNFCRDSMIAYTRAIDLRLNKMVRKGEPAFKKDWDMLVREKSTEAYINDLLKELKNTSSLNLWDFTLKHPSMNGDSEQAIKMIGVLFWDAETRGYELSSPLGRKVDTLRALVVDKKRDNQMTFFPKGVPEDDYAPYHFYAAAYAALKMKKDGAKLEQSTLMPYLIADFYETDIGRSDVKDMEKDDISDVYLGFYGAVFGSTIKNGEKPKLDKLLMNYPDFIERYPKERHELIIKELKRIKGI